MIYWMASDSLCGCAEPVKLTEGSLMGSKSKGVAI